MTTSDDTLEVSHSDLRRIRDALAHARAALPISGTPRVVGVDVRAELTAAITRIVELLAGAPAKPPG